MKLGTCGIAAAFLLSSGNIEAAAQSTVRVIQQDAADPRPAEEGHLEQKDQDPVSAPPVIATSRPANPVFGSFESIQVNVDDNGNNIVGDAANEPSIAIDPNDPTRMVAGWRQFDSIASNFRQAGRAYSHTAGQSWRSKAPLQAGIFRSDPVLDVNSDGQFYYYSLTDDFTTDVFISNVSGVDYGDPIPNFGGDKNWMTVDRTVGQGAGNLYFAWSVVAGCCGNDTFTRSTDGGQTYLTPVVQRTAWGTMNVGPDGTLYLGGIQAIPGFDTGTILLQRSSNAQDPNNNKPTFGSTVVDLGGGLSFSTGPNPAGLLGQVWVATDHSGGANDGNVYLCASVNPPGSDPLDVHFARSTDGGQTFSPWIKINDDDKGNDAYQWFATMSVAPNGRIDVIWNDTRNDPGNVLSQVFYSSSSDGGLTFSANQELTPQFDSTLGWPQQNKLGDYYDMVSDDVGAHLLYAATFNGEQDVYYLRIGPPDCNGNGVDDALDIAGGDSLDVDGNAVPDECETLLLSQFEPGVAGQFNSLHFTRATPNSFLFIFVGSTPANLPLGCGGFLGMSDPILLGRFQADVTGELTLGVDVDAGLSGVSLLLQGIETTCRSSNTIAETF